MPDLSREMSELRARLPGAGPHGRLVLVVAARGGEGASTVAREYARAAAVGAARPVWLVDGDFDRPSQFEAAGAEADRFGWPGRARSASPDGSCFFAVEPPWTDGDGRRVADAEHLFARPFLDGRLWITRFRPSALQGGREARAVADGRYWRALKAAAGEVVVDAPAAERSALAVAVAPYADLVLMVVAGERTGAVETLALKRRLIAAGAPAIGLVWSAPGRPAARRRAS